MSSTDAARVATTSRSVRLFRLFLKEQSDPDLFYSAFADDSVAALRWFADLEGATVLDVGGGPGYFARAFRSAGARYIGVELDVPTDATGEVVSIRGSGTALPIRDGVIDIAYCSNVVEHVQDAWTMADEMVRVTRSGGLLFLSYTPWRSPWGGHETAPWHYLGGVRAADRYARRHGHRPKNDFGRTLFAHRAADAVAWARGRSDVEIVRAYPRYHPHWAWWTASVPGLREWATWNYTLVLRRR